MSVLLRASLRYHLHHRLQLVLALLGVTLGVAVVVAVDAATGSARRAFQLSTEAVTGRATHEIVGGPGGITTEQYVAIMQLLPAGVAAAPVIDRYVMLTTRSGARRRFRLLGIDPFSDAPFRSYAVPTTGELDTGVLIAQRALLLSAGTAAELTLRAGDTLVVQFGSMRGAAVLGGTIEPGDDLGREALADVALADIATVQELTGAFDGVDRIELRADVGAGVDGLESSLPAGLRVLPMAARAGATARLTRAFDINLTALALVALVFGMFLIYNSVSFSVVQRRSLLGLLRAQGVTAAELLRLILLEAAVLGAAAIVLGTVAGTLLGTLLLRLVARTINDLYFAVAVAAVHISPFTLVKAAVLGFGATLAAAAAPALEAVRAPTRATLSRAQLERRTARNAPRLAGAGSGVALAALLLLAIPSRSIVLGFAGLFVLILAAALLTPALTTAVMRALLPLVARVGVVGRIAVRGVTTSLSRTAPAIAALGVALAVGIAVTVLIASFRGGVVAWLDQSLQADLYVASPTAGANRTDVTLPAELADRIRALPGVDGVSTYRHTDMLIGESMVRVIAIDMHDRHRDMFQLLERPRDVWQRFAAGELLVSEPFAYRRDTGPGEFVVLPGEGGAVRVPIAGVFRDYASEHGVIFIDRSRYEQLWSDRAITSVAVFSSAADLNDLMRRIRDLPAADGTIVGANRALRESTLQIFDRTFLITGVLRVLALLVAFVGVTGALMALQLERSRETGILRAAGLTPAQVWGLAAAQTSLMGVAAVALAVPLGAAMSWAMVHVINRRSFGWSFDLLLSAGPFLQALGVGVAAALLAGMYPAFRLARTRPAAVLRGE